MKLIINADDFGITESCTRAIFDAYNQKLITDTTMVANCDAFDLAVALSEEHEIRNNIGVHFNLTEGIPLTENIKMHPKFVSNGRFHGNINRLMPLSASEKKAVYDELTAQIERIEAAGIKLTHADSHHHIHTAIFIAPIVLKVCKERGIDKIRLHRNIGQISKFKIFVKNRYNDWLTSNGFKTTRYFGSLEDIRNGIPDGVTEVMVHPDYDKNGAIVDRHSVENGFVIGTKMSDVHFFPKDDCFSYKKM